MEFENDAFAENPNADVISVSSVKISAEGFRGIFPSPGRCDEAVIYSIVEDVRYFEVLGDHFCCIHAVLMLPDEIPFAALLYASEFVLNEYRPRIGDPIAAKIWLQVVWKLVERCDVMHQRGVFLTGTHLQRHPPLNSHTG